MKKLTSLQILMLMGLAVGSSHMYGKQPAMTIQDAQAVELTLEAEQNRVATKEVLSDLSPKTIERIIQDRAKLVPSFNQIDNIIKNINKELEKLSKANSVNEEDIARLAVELADAQADLEEAQAVQNVKHKKAFHGEQAIKDGLMKAEQGLKSLNKKAIEGLQEVEKIVVKHAKKVSAKADQAVKQIKESKTGKAVKAAKDKVQNAHKKMMAPVKVDADEVAVQAMSTQQSGHKKSAAEAKKSGKATGQAKSKAQAKKASHTKGQHKQS